MKTYLLLGMILSAQIGLTQQITPSFGGESGGGTPDYPQYLKIIVNRTLTNNPEIDAAKYTVLALIGRSISIGQITGYRGKVEQGKIVYCVDLGKNNDVLTELIE